MQRLSIGGLVGPGDATIVDVDAAVFNSTLELKEEDLLEVSSLVPPRDPPVFNPTLSLHDDDLLELRGRLDRPKEVLSSGSWQLPRHSLLGGALRWALPPLAVTGVFFAAVTLSRDEASAPTPRRIVTYGTLYTVASGLAAAPGLASAREGVRAARVEPRQPAARVEPRQPAALRAGRRLGLSAGERRQVRRHLAAARRAAGQRRWLVAGRRTAAARKLAPRNREARSIERRARRQLRRHRRHLAGARRAAKHRRWRETRRRAAAALRIAPRDQRALALKRLADRRLKRGSS